MTKRFSKQNYLDAKRSFIGNNETFRMPLHNNGVLNRTAFDKAIDYAFHDMTPRTMKRADEVDFSEIIREGQKSFYETFKRALTLQDQTSFDEWHHECMKKVVEFLKKHYKKESCTIGKAQKVVNMTFKNLCCYQGGEKENVFNYCHMPIDSWILEWCSRNITEYKGWKSCSWSNIDKQYDGYQKAIRDEASKHGLSPLQLEFIIWPRIQKEIVVDGMLNCFDTEPEKGERSYSEKIKKMSLEKKIERIKDLLENMEP